MAEDLLQPGIPVAPEPNGEHDAVLRRARVGVVLAAGRSERLRRVTAGGSKALVRVGGLSLVERAVRRLLALGLERVVVVVGYQAGPVAALVNRLAPGRVRAVYAERWEEGNGASLAAAEPHLREEDVFVLVTADHVFGEGALEGLLSSSGPAVLVDHAPAPGVWAEGTRVRLHEERVVAFSKELEDPSVDCGAFLLPQAVFAAQRRAEREGDASLAGAVTDLARHRPMDAVALRDGTWWLDVDTPDDLRHAKRTLRRSLARRSDGPVARHLNRPISTRISMALAPLRPHPDLVSLAAFLLGLAAAAALALGRGILGGVLAQSASVLDGVDGELARLQDRARPAGALLDGVLDRLADAAVIAGLTIWALDAGADPRLVAALGVGAATVSMFSMATKDRIAALGLPPAPEHGIAYLLGGRDGRLLLIAVAALLTEPLWGLVAVIATGGLSLATRLLLVHSWRDRNGI